MSAESIIEKVLLNICSPQFKIQYSKSRTPRVVGKTCAISRTDEQKQMGQFEKFLSKKFSHKKGKCLYCDRGRLARCIDNPKEVAESVRSCFVSKGRFLFHSCKVVIPGTASFPD